METSDKGEGNYIRLKLYVSSKMTNENKLKYRSWSTRKQFLKITTKDITRNLHVKPLRR